MGYWNFITPSTGLFNEIFLNVTRPNMCPICHTTISAKIVSASSELVELHHQLRVVYQCPNAKCLELFIGSYIGHTGGQGKIRCNLIGVEPLSFEKVKFSEEINNLSPTFGVVYNQALEAEGRNLNEICGMGYRKAFEFLVKDFAIKYNPEQEEQIKTKLLGPCIKDYILDPRIKDLAERAAWLGNDETHYVRKWEGKDVGHLKQLIELVRLKIEQELLYEKFLTDMPGGKR